MRHLPIAALGLLGVTVVITGLVADTPEVDRLEASLRLDRTSAVVGQDVHATFVLRNRGTRSVQVPSRCDGSVDVLVQQQLPADAGDGAVGRAGVLRADLLSRPVVLTDEGQASAATCTTRLPPGRSLTRTLTWRARTFNDAAYGGAAVRLRVEPRVPVPGQRLRPRLGATPASESPRLLPASAVVDLVVQGGDPTRPTAAQLLDAALAHPGFSREVGRTVLLDTSSPHARGSLGGGFGPPVTVQVVQRTDALSGSSGAQVQVAGDTGRVGPLTYWGITF